MNPLPLAALRRLALATLTTGGAIALSWAVSATPASAHQSPADCDSNSVDATPTRDKLLVRNGDVINYTVSIRNINQSGQAACDLSDATVVLTLPAIDGTPTGTKVTLATGANYPVGTTQTFPGTTKWVVNVNPGVTDAVVMVEVAGKLHDAPVDHAASIKKTLGTTVTQPHTTLSVTASPTVGRAPLDVVFTYREKNDSSTDVPISGVTISDTNCAPVVYQSGDTNNNQILDNNETWVFTCKKTITSGGTYTSDVVGKGTSGVDTRAVADELASLKVNIAQPHSVITKAATPKKGVAPLKVTYAYTYKNDGKDGLSNLALVDDKCTPVTYTGGDTNHDGIVQPGETWTFSCSQTFTSPGTFPNTVTATAIDIVDHVAVLPLTAKDQVVVTSAAVTPTIAPAVPPTQPPVVLGETVTKPKPAPSVAPKVAPSVFARTGIRIAGMVLLALVAIGLGAFLVMAARRRRTETT